MAWLWHSQGTHRLIFVYISVGFPWRLDAATLLRKIP